MRSSNRRRARACSGVGAVDRVDAQQRRVLLVAAGRSAGPGDEVTAAEGELPGLLDRHVDVVATREVPLHPDEAVSLVAEVEDALDLDGVAGERLVGPVGAAPLAPLAPIAAPTAATAATALAGLTFSIGVAAVLGLVGLIGLRLIVLIGALGLLGALGPAAAAAPVALLAVAATAVVDALLGCRRALDRGVLGRRGAAVGVAVGGRRGLGGLVGLGARPVSSSSAPRTGAAGGGGGVLGREVVVVRGVRGLRSGGLGRRGRRRRGLGPGGRRHAGELEDEADDVGLLGAGGGLSAERGGDGDEFVAVLALEG